MAGDLVGFGVNNQFNNGHTGQVATTGAAFAADARIIGRDADAGHRLERLGAHRLVMLTGPGEVGKRRR